MGILKMPERNVKNVDIRTLIQRRILQELQDARASRPACHLTWSLSADEDGRVWLGFQCVTHGATWRYLEYSPEDLNIASLQSPSYPTRTPCFAEDNHSADSEEGE